MAQNALYFIQPHVLDRLITGKFVAKRQQNKYYKMRDRRDSLSPLNVTRRAIRYEPLVFSNRRTQIITAAQALNNPEKKLFLITGPTGRGKTAFVRGLAEMMGGGEEQLLWFDVSRHTDFDEVIRFLIDYMTYVLRTKEEAQEVPEGQDPIATLDLLLRRAADQPVLIVIDNVEHLVAPDKTIHSRELKEAFNFLLSFPNVKLVLVGSQLPLRDMNPTASAVYHLMLDALTEAESREAVGDWIRQPEVLQDVAFPFLNRLDGEPLLLCIFAHLLNHQADRDYWKAIFADETRSPEQNLVHALNDQLSKTEQTLLAVLASIRHGIPLSALEAMVRFCLPELGDIPTRHLDQTLVRLALKKVYPPQLVLNKLRNRQQGDDKNAIEAYYQVIESIQDEVLRLVPDELQWELHQQLHQFYNSERNKHILERIVDARTRHLIAEANYHFNRSKRRRTLPRPMPSKPTVKPAVDSVSMTDWSEPPRGVRMPTQPVSGFASLVPDEEEYDASWSLPSEELSGLPPTVLAREERPPIAGISSPSLSIQLEPTHLSVPTVRLTDEDLEKLAQLITQSGSIQASSIQRRAETPIQSPSLPPAEAPPLEDAVPQLLGLEALTPKTGPVTPEEQAIVTRLQAAIQENQVHGVTQALVSLGTLRLRNRNERNGEECLLKALQFAEDTQDTKTEAEIHGILGHHYQTHFQHNKSLRHLRELEHLYDQLPVTQQQQKQLAQAYQDMAEIYLYRQDWTEALSVLHKCLALVPDDPSFSSDILFHLALAYDEASQTTQALDYYQQSLEAYQQLNQDGACAVVLYNLAGLYLEQQDVTSAEDAITRCLAYDQKAGPGAELIRTHMLASRIYEAAKRPDKVYEQVHFAFKLAEKAQLKPEMATACLRLAELKEHQHAWADAGRFYQQALLVAGSDLSTDSRRRIQQKLQSIQERLS